MLEEPRAAQPKHTTFPSNVFLLESYSLSPLLLNAKPFGFLVK